MIIYGDLIPKLFSIFMRVEAVTLWPFIFARNGTPYYLINHERIHLEQQKELWVIGFYFLYVWDYLSYLDDFINPTDNKTVKEVFQEAYYNIRFEKEAYENMHNSTYTFKRGKYGWKRYS
jgi:hypothetical protein